MIESSEEIGETREENFLWWGKASDKEWRTGKVWVLQRRLGA